MTDFQPISGLVGRLPTTFGDDPRGPGEMGKNDFLKLMIAQLNYQDPMNPLDATQFSTQLAQYTTVEELQNLNSVTETGIEANVLLAQSINNTMSATLIGKDVKALVGTLSLTDGENAEIWYDLPEAAGGLTATILDSNGIVVRTLSESDLQAGEGTIEWDGKDDAGNKMPDGTYSVQLSYTDYLGNSAETPAYLIGRVEAVRYTSNGAILIVNGRNVNFGDVLEVRDTGDDGSSLLELLGLVNP